MLIERPVASETGAWQVLCVRRSWLLHKFGVSMVFAAGCAAQAPPATTVPSHEAALAAHRRRSRVPQVQEPLQRAALLATVPAGSFGPYFARGETGGILVWAVTRAPGDTEVLALQINSEFEKIGTPRVVAKLEGSLERLALKSVRWGETSQRRGFAVLASSAVTSEAGASRHRIQLLALDSSGIKLNELITLAESVGGTYWLDALDLAHGPLLTWARARGKTADVVVLKLNAFGVPVGNAESVARDVKAWQMVPFGEGAALAVIQGQLGVKAQGSVEVLRLSHAGAKLGAATVVAKSPTANLDLDLTALANNLLLSWSDTQSGEARILWSLVSPTGTVLREPRALSPVGEQTLLKLVPSTSADRAFAIWEQKPSRGEHSRDVHVASVFDDGSVGEAVASIETVDSASWELEASSTPQGLTLLVPGRVCRSQASCEAKSAPSVVQLAPDLSVLGSQPLFLRGAGQERSVPLAWNLSCARSRCLVLAAKQLEPAPIYSLALEQGSTPYLPIAKRLVPEARPRVVENSVLEELLAPIADLSLASSSPGRLLSWVTQFDPNIPYENPKTPAPDGKLLPVRAELSALPLVDFKPNAGAAPVNSPATLVKPLVVSYRAHSAGGVALAAGPKGESLLVWTALDAGKPQVFVTLLDARGQRTKQRMLTRLGREVSDVVAIHVAGGWVVGWVDERDNDRELYVTKLDRALVNIAQEVRVSHVPGIARSPVFQLTSAGLRMAWSDGESATQASDIYTSLIDPVTFSVTQPDARCVETSGARSLPQLAKLGDDVVVGWVERTTTATANEQLLFGTLLDNGTLAKESRRVELPSGKVASLALECSVQCRALALLDAEPFGSLLAFRWSGQAPIAMKALFQTSTGSAQGLAMADDQCVFAENLNTGESRIRQLKIEW